MKIKIKNKYYEVLDSIEKITIADSFVVPANKIGSGNGEAKLYIGPEGDVLRDFYGPVGFKINCVILKKDILQYLNDSKDEYQHPEQEYRKKDIMPKIFLERLHKARSLDEELFFKLEEQTQITPPRVYAKSSDDNFELIREFSLPEITYISIMKLESEDKEILFYIRLFVDYFGEIEHPSKIKKEESLVQEEKIGFEEKIQIIKARIGQGKYRTKLLGDCPFCPITLVTDDRLLIASHIKPWVDSSDEEKIDFKNGFMFTPNIDRLFDRGFITFNDNKEMLISPWISKMTCHKLNIIPNKKYEKLPIEGREKYLEYHRNNIYKS